MSQHNQKKNSGFKILSCFDGMSVAQQALQDAGIPVEVYYASEIDKYAIAVTQSNFPETIQLGSVENCQFTSYWESKKYIDLMIGGSPCQDLSIAQKNREGLKGSRSGLFWEYVRILNEVKPKYFILENVNSMPKEAKEVISEALGVQPVMINASLVSAQNRKRLFWVGKLDEFGTYKQVEIPQPEDRGILLKDILEDAVDEKYFLVKDNKLTPNGNPDIAGTLDTGTWLKRYEQIRRVYGINNKAPTIPTGTGGGVMTKIATGNYFQYDENNKGNKSQDQRIYFTENKMGTLPSNGTDSKIKIFKDGIRKLTPTECLRLQSMPDDYFEKAEIRNKPISNTQRYKMCGNAFNKEVIVHILKHLK
jgi:DNA (cytosine-5)-methyltransferase 3A